MWNPRSCRHFDKLSFSPWLKPLHGLLYAFRDSWLSSVTLLTIKTFLGVKGEAARFEVVRFLDFARHVKLAKLDCVGFSDPLRHQNNGLVLLLRRAENKIRCMSDDYSLLQGLGSMVLSCQHRRDRLMLVTTTSVGITHWANKFFLI